MNSDFCVAVHGLVFLNHKGTVLSSEELAENICTNPVRVRRVMAQLKKAGLVETQQGNAGGYRTPETAPNFTLAQIAQALDTRFVSVNWHSGDVDQTCLVSSGMGGIMEGIFGELNGLCLARLTGLTVGDIDKQIFGAKENFDETV